MFRWILSKENGKVSDEALKLIVKISEGSVRDALSLLDRALLSLDKDMELDLIAAQKIFAYSSVKAEDVEKFKMQFEKKGRALLQISVEIRDINDTLTSEARFLWFVQARPKKEL